LGVSESALSPESAVRSKSVPWNERPASLRADGASGRYSQWAKHVALRPLMCDLRLVSGLTAIRLNETARKASAS
jgi:hypothetical protein